MTTSSLHTGTSLSGGRYEITQKLGVGGMATVYLAHDNNLNVAVAIKFPDPNLLQNADFRDRFFQETRSLVSLRHPNILKIIDVGQQDGTPYAVMDYLSGGSVNDQRFQDNQGNYLPVVPVFFDKWLNRIADALDFIHRKGYVHRDIKPDNILFDDHGNAFLSDFGIAKVYEETKTSEQANLTRTGMLIGTPEYMAPEISLGQKYDGRSDQYSLAVLVYELLVGSRPFVGATPAALVMKQMQKEFHQLSELQRRWGKSVASVLTRALATEPGARFASCCEFEGELARAFASTPDRHIDERVVSKCPTCSAPIAIQPEWIGKIARCNKCSERIQIQATGMVIPASAVSAIPQQMAGSVPVTNQQPAGPRCPGCDTALRISANLRGKKVKCAACEMLLRISENGSHCVAAPSASVTPTLINQSLGPFTDTSPQGLASISSTYSSPIGKFAAAKTSISKPLIAVAVGMIAMLGIGVWFFMGGDVAPPIVATNSVIETPTVTEAAPSMPVPTSVASEPISPQTPPIPIAPFSEDEAKSHQAAWAAYLDQPVELTNSIGMKLNLIPAGTFMMGSPSSEAGRKDNETQHRVTLTKPYYLGTTEVTQGQWESVMGTAPWKGQKYVQEESNNAATYISWEDAVEFCRKLSAKEGKAYRLPTEAEWEYACRGGTTTAYSFGDDAAQLSEYAWWGGISGNGNSQTEQYAHAVAQKRANAFGLYDIHGNVWEWCSDWYGNYPAGSATDPQGATNGVLRGLRGGCWFDVAPYCRTALRNGGAPTFGSSDFGFRLALSSEVPIETATGPAAALQASSSSSSIIPTSEASERISPQTPPIPIAPFSEDEAKAHQAAWAAYLTQPVEFTNSIGVKLKLIPAGTFMMGSPESETSRKDNETHHSVTLTKPYYLGTTEVTQGQWESVMGTTPWKGQKHVQEGSNNAATYISWEDAVEFCRKLSAKEGKAYRLPTEAEWEYACRAGTTTSYSFGDGAAQLSEYAWWGGFSGGNSQTEQYAHAVGLKRANAFGLYDMHGNVWELCSDWYGDYLAGSETDPQGATNGARRVYRDGSWGGDAADCRAAFRDSYTPSFRYTFGGLRLALSPEVPSETSAGPAAPLQTSSSTNASVPASAASEYISPQTPPIAMAPFAENEAKAHQAAWAAHLDQPVELTNSIGMNLKLIPAGTFMMGSAASEVGRSNAETQHRVTLTKPYYLATTEVTQGQWESVMGTTPWKGQKYVREGSNNAATYISWEDAVEFCRNLSAKEGKTYRLPTEAEWEYACRAGTTTSYSFGSNAAQLSEYAWWGGISGNGNTRTEQYAHAVGLKRANAFGLYDMHGNVWEWCWDWYGNYPAGNATDPQGATNSATRVLRGGSWLLVAAGCRSADRRTGTPTDRSKGLGLRVALSPSSQDR